MPSPETSEQDPRISILMANFENARFLPDAIRSVQQQTDGRWELVVLDDASGDDSVAVIERYLGDPRIRLLRQPENRGYIESLRRLIDEARCERVAILDADDALAPEAVACLQDAFDADPECGFVYSRFQLCDEALRPVTGAFDAAPIPAGLSNLHVDAIYHVRAFRRALYRETAGFGDEYLFAEDKDISYRLEERSTPRFIDRQLYLWREVAGSQSRAPRKKELGRISFALASADAFLRRRGTTTPNLSRRRVLALLASALWRAIRLGDGTVARRVLVRVKRVLTTR